MHNLALVIYDTYHHAHWSLWMLQQDPTMANFMQGMNNPSYRHDIEEKLADLKKDPELAAIMKEIEEGGPAAMTK